MLRLVMPALLLFPALCLGQAQEGDAEKFSNDRADRPLQMPPASSEVKEAFDDFERFSRRGAWERALKGLYTIPEEQASRFVDGRDRFIIPASLKRREVLAGLPPEGQVAYRLFYDADAKKLLDQADGKDELKTLEHIFSAYFYTSIGDEAADRLGDLYFQFGRFDRAADCWLAILRERPDSELPPALISVKAALALAHAGRRSQVDSIRREVSDRYADEPVTIGGREATAAEHLSRLLNADGALQETAGERHSPGGAGASPRVGPELSGTVPSAWQIRFAESVVAGMSPQELVQWETNPLSGAVPAVAVAGSRLFANYLGYVFAVDLPSGKLIWRSASFHNVEIPARQDHARWIEPNRFAVLASDSHVWSLSRDLNDTNQRAPFRLTCRRADVGAVVWQTADLPDYAQLDLVGMPILADGSIFIAARTPRNQQQGKQQQFVLAIRARDGKLLWKTEVGMFRQGQSFFYGMPDPSPLPRLAHDAEAVYVDTHVGVLARLDSESGELEWGYGYATDPVQSSGRFIIFPSRMSTEPATSASSVPLLSGPALFVKGEQSDRIAALDPDRMECLWDRPIAKSARLLGADERRVYLGGPEIGALDRETRELLWATRLPGGSAEWRVLVRPDGLWQMTPRGIFELDPASGQIRRIFRGDDTGSDGGDLFLTDRLMLAVTNRTISAYPIAEAEAVSRDAASTNAGGSDD